MKSKLPGLFISLVLTSILSSVCIAQEKISPVLKERIQSNNKGNQVYKVIIVLNDKVNFIKLNERFAETNATCEERARITLRSLHEKSVVTQQPVIEYLLEIQQKNPLKVQTFESFWIANCISAELTPDVIYGLDELSEIEIIDIDERKYTYPEPHKGESSDLKTIGGVEPGITAINAPAMWALGYTGRNRIALGYDTGVNFQHPAIADRFLGNYLPLAQCFHTMYDFQYPVDVSPSTHGTHTIGTVLGLEKETNDTIGIAFNAYWIVTDPIVSSEADIRPFSEYMKVFEWVLNPDGDTATVNDIPDAINNSWGIAPTHPYYECDPVESLILDAVDAAGIANIFSAGNEGPDEETIGMPANIARSLVNVFSVGAVLGTSQSFPIADFSSHGPTPCYTGADISLKTKPEVVAPGVNVRSAQGNDSYQQLSGTSMAAPHVTGAVLLLKEAFPYLPGSEILLALYNSTKDLGDVGEDNVYGKGLIDVLAAYNYLALTHTPLPPVSNDYDLAIQSVTYPDFDYIETASIEPKIVVKNNGLQDISDFSISYGLLGETPEYYSYTGDLAAGETVEVTLPEIATIEGMNQLVFRADLLIDVIESDIINNQAKYAFNVLKNKSFPFIETFENYSNADLEDNWALVNPDRSITWRIDSTKGVGVGDKSLSMKFLDYVQRNAELDELVSPVIEVPTTGAVNLKFSWAYAKRLEHIYKDSLLIYISTDGGATFADKIFADGGKDFATIAENITHVDFVPQDTSDWNDTIIDISEFANSGSITLKFVAKNDNGNDLYIDNIKVYSETEPVIIPQLSQNDILIYPNPVKDVFIVEQIGDDQAAYEVTITDAMGRIMCRKSIDGIPKTEINVLDFDPGLYFVIIQGEKGYFTKKVVKME